LVVSTTICIAGDNRRSAAGSKSEEFEGSGYFHLELSTEFRSSCESSVPRRRHRIIPIFKRPTKVHFMETCIP
jgi:hypothetical protein